MLFLSYEAETGHRYYENCCYFWSVNHKTLCHVSYHIALSYGVTKTSLQVKYKHCSLHTAFVWCDSVANRYSNRRECPMLLTTPFDLNIITKRKKVAPHLPVDDAAMLKSGTARLIGCGIISNEIKISHEFTSAQTPYFSLHVGLLSCSANIYHPLCGWYMTCNPMHGHDSILLYVCAHRMIRNRACFVPSHSTWPTVAICHGGRPPFPSTPLHRTINYRGRSMA
jgi:hypothetical protein